MFRGTPCNKNQDLIPVRDDIWNQRCWMSPLNLLQLWMPGGTPLNRTFARRRTRLKNLNHLQSTSVYHTSTTVTTYKTKFTKKNLNKIEWFKNSETGYLILKQTKTHVNKINILKICFKIINIRTFNRVLYTERVYTIHAVLFHKLCNFLCEFIYAGLI